ncbi:50S ribosomal protein L15, partial [Thermus scotoductus]|uniref:uL15m family ribosomal protein n=1 Tax=Thermus scotoductus TaxID=37636 RepID=UPI000F808E3B
MNLTVRKPNPGANKSVKGVGGGGGSGEGKRGTGGNKGQKGRTGGLKEPRRVEGGSSTTLMRLPKRGMQGQVPGEIKRPKDQGVNLRDLARFDGEVTPEVLDQAGILKEGYRLNVLGEGEAKPRRVVAHAFSETALDKLNAAGGEAVLRSPSPEGQAPMKFLP